MHSLEHSVLRAYETLPSASLMRNGQPGAGTSLMVTKDLIYGLRRTTMSIVYFFNIISTLLNEWVRGGHHILVKGIRLVGHSAISKLSRHRSTLIFHRKHLDLFGESEVIQVVLTEHIKVSRLSEVGIELAGASREVSLLCELTCRAISDLLDIGEGFIERWGRLNGHD